MIHIFHSGAVRFGEMLKRMDFTFLNNMVLINLKNNASQSNTNHSKINVKVMGKLLV
jgi:hypothetical protein